MWHSLQELAGINNSHAQKLLAREKKAWEERMQQEAEAHAPAAPAAAASVAPASAAVTPAAASAAAAPEPERSPDEAYIETERCSTCNECTQINGKMFAYNADKQAYVKDARAGTFQQLVIAAERCPVSIIHPGSPLNPKEKDLAKWVKRAEKFN